MTEGLLQSGVFAHTLVSRVTFEPSHEKTGFFMCKKQRRRSPAGCTVTSQLISANVFATQIVQSLYFVNPKFQGSGHFLCPYSQVCVGPGRIIQRQFFS